MNSKSEKLTYTGQDSWLPMWQKNEKEVQNNLLNVGNVSCINYSGKQI